MTGVRACRWRTGRIAWQAADSYQALARSIPGKVSATKRDAGHSPSRTVYGPPPNDNAPVERLEGSGNGASIVAAGLRVIDIDRDDHTGRHGPLLRSRRCTTLPHGWQGSPCRYRIVATSAGDRPCPTGHQGRAESRSPGERHRSGAPLTRCGSTGSGVAGHPSGGRLPARTGAGGRDRATPGTGVWFVEVTGCWGTAKCDIAGSPPSMFGSNPDPPSSRRAGVGRWGRPLWSLRAHRVDDCLRQVHPCVVQVEACPGTQSGPYRNAISSGDTISSARRLDTLRYGPARGQGRDKVGPYRKMPAARRGQRTGRYRGACPPACGDR